MQRILTQIVYGGQTLPVSPSDLFIMADLMSFFMQKQGETQETSIQIAVRTFVYLQIGHEQQKREAKNLLNQVVEWDLTQDFATSIQYKSLCKDILLNHLKNNENIDVL